MIDAAALLALLLLLTLGFALLARSQARHRPAAASPAARAALRWIGYGLVALGLPLAWWRDGGAFGSLLWACLLSPAAFAVTAALSWRARRLHDAIPRRVD